MAVTDDWSSAFHAHNAQQCKQQLRRRAVLALALISEPLERQWNEIFLDLAWAAWLDVVRSARRAYQLPKAQRMYEKVLHEAHGAMGVSCFSVWRSGYAIPSNFSDSSLTLLLQRALPFVQESDIDLLLDVIPRDQSGHVSLEGLVSWIFPATSERGDATPLQEWQEEWKVCQRQKHEHVARCRALLVLSLIAEPFQHCWREVFLDLAWWAWSSIVLDSKRRKSLPVRQAEFEQEAVRLSADSGCWNRVSLDDTASAALHNLNWRS